MSIIMRELPVSERPYEKLEMYGAGTLSNSELLAIIIKAGTREETAVTLAQRILNITKNDISKIEDLKALADISIDQLTKIKGIGKVKAVQILAVLEIAKRMSKPLQKLDQKITNTDDIARILLEELRYEKREKVKVILLNSKNEILKITDISLGGTNFSIIEPKDILVEALKLQAPKIILVHNHPSGDPTPSKGDYCITDRIYEAADIMGIQLIDHVIIGDGKYQSVFSKRKEDKK